MPVPPKQTPVRNIGVQEERGLGRPVYLRDIRPSKEGELLGELVEQLDPEGRGVAGQFMAEKKQQLQAEVATAEALGRPLDELPLDLRLVFGAAGIEEEAQRIRGEREGKAAFDDAVVALSLSPQANAMPHEQIQFVNDHITKSPRLQELAPAGQETFAATIPDALNRLHGPAVQRYAAAQQQEFLVQHSANFRQDLNAEWDQHGDFNADRAMAYKQSLMQRGGLSEAEAEELLARNIVEFSRTRIDPVTGDPEAINGDWARVLYDSGLIRTPKVREYLISSADSLDDASDVADRNSRIAEEAEAKALYGSVLSQAVTEYQRTGNPAVFTQIDLSALQAVSPTLHAKAFSTLTTLQANSIRQERGNLSAHDLNRLEEMGFRGEIDVDDSRVVNLGREDLRRVTSAIKAGKEYGEKTLKRDDVVPYFKMIDEFLLRGIDRDLVHNTNVLRHKTMMTREFVTLANTDQWRDKPSELAEKLYAKYAGLLLGAPTAQPAPTGATTGAPAAPPAAAPAAAPKPAPAKQEASGQSKPSRYAQEADEHRADVEKARSQTDRLGLTNGIDLEAEEAFTVPGLPY